MNKEAYVTLATNDSYARGAIVLAESLRNTGASRTLCCITATNGGVSPMTREMLGKCFDKVFEVQELYSSSLENLALLGRPELAVTFTKIMVWSLVQFEKVVFLDADMLVLQCIDDLFERPDFSACPDSGWPDCFNTGLFVCKPSLETMQELIRKAASAGSFDGGDQGLLNGYFSNWSTLPHFHRIPFTYNVTFSLYYSYKPAFLHFYDQIRAIHFIGPNKPWLIRMQENREYMARKYSLPPEMIQFIEKWWAIYKSSPYGNQLTENANSQSILPKSKPQRTPEFIDFKVNWGPETEYLAGLDQSKYINEESYRIMPLMLEELAVDDSFFSTTDEDEWEEL